MALASTSLFASFDINDQTNILDISNVLSEALILDFEFMSRGLDAAMDDPVEDTTFYWNEEALNSDRVTVSGSVTSSATSITVDAAHGLRVHIGDTLKNTAEASTEVIEVTAISTDTLTVVRGVNFTTQASIADDAVLVVMPSFQEGSDIGVDKSVKPVARNNFTQIVFAGDLLITRSQLQRKMATIAMDVDRQLANRAIELKRYWTNIALYGEKSANDGSDTAYRRTLGLRGWARDNSGVLDSTDEVLDYDELNANNKLVVDKGAYPDTLVIGTDLVDAIANIDNANRNLLESDQKVGYSVNQIHLKQGNSVNVVVDGRVHAGDAFLYRKDQFSWHPLKGAAMFVIAATDFVDGVKRRIGSEGGFMCRNPETVAYLSTKSVA